MKFTITKQDFLESLSLASRFTSTKLTTISSLQGVFMEGKGKDLHLYATNLNSFFHTKLKITEGKEFKIIIDPKKIGEFLSLLDAGKVDVEVKEKELLITQGKTKGSFGVMDTADFPLPPKITEETLKIDTKFLTDEVSKVLFSTASDDTRPVLTAVNFEGEDEALIIVTTDGFRLSLLKTKKEGKFPSMLVTREFLSEVLRYAKSEKEVELSYSSKEKMVVFKAGACEFYSRLIDGEFPPYERVIPAEKKTTIEIDREEFLRGVKLISVFARDFSNIVIVEFTKEGVHIRPKGEKQESDAFLEVEAFEGDTQKVAFNFRFLIEFLNNADGKKIIVEVLRPDAPVVFRLKGQKDYLHIIMPVRLQSE